LNKELRYTLKNIEKARLGENTTLYGQSWIVLTHIDLVAELVKNGEGGASTPNLINNLYFIAIEQARRGKHKTDFIIIWGYMGAH